MFFTILYSIYFLIIFLGFSTFLIIIYPFFILFKKKRQWELFLQRVASLWGRCVIRGTFSKVSVEGIEKIPSGNVLFVANHQSYFDIPLIMGYVGRGGGFVAKVELKKVPILSFWMKRLHCVFIDRKKLKEANKYIEEAIQNLKSGYSMVIFPEGTRSRGKEMRNFKPGSFKLAFKTNVPIVPLSINGTYNLFEKKGRIASGKIKILVHDPVYPDNFSEDEKIAFVKKIEEIVRDGVEKDVSS